MRVRLIPSNRNMVVGSCSCGNATDRGKSEKGLCGTGGGSTSVQKNQYFGGTGPAALPRGTMHVKAKTKTSNRHFRDRIRQHFSPRR
jgi:hypothetical protein